MKNGMEENIKAAIKDKVSEEESPKIKEAEKEIETVISPAEKFTGIYDLEDPRAFNPQREKYKREKKNGKAKKKEEPYSFVSVYMKKEEQEYLKKLAAKYHMSMAAVVRMLILNSK